jgi:hypothetical protein
MVASHKGLNETDGPDNLPISKMVVPEAQKLASATSKRADLVAPFESSHQVRSEGFKLNSKRRAFIKMPLSRHLGRRLPRAGHVTSHKFQPRLSLLLVSSSAGSLQVRQARQRPIKLGSRVPQGLQRQRTTPPTNDLKTPNGNLSHQPPQRTKPQSPILQILHQH